MILRDEAKTSTGADRRAQDDQFGRMPLVIDPERRDGPLVRRRRSGCGKLATSKLLCCRAVDAARYLSVELRGSCRIPFVQAVIASTMSAIASSV